jgi:hypothetical protein
MKKINYKKLLGLCLVAAFFVSCKQPEGENGNTMELKIGKFTLALDAGVSCKTPDWTKNPKGNQSLPAVIENGSASNVNANIMTGIKKLPANDISVKNVIFMFYENLNDDLIESTEEKYGELITNDLPQKLTFTAQKLDENKNEDNVIGFYLTDSCYKKIGYATTDLISNSVFRQFKGTYGSDSSDLDLVNHMIIELPRPIFMLARDTANENTKSVCSVSSSSYVNEIYKSEYKYTSDFKEAVDCYNNEEVLFQGFSGHPDKKVSVRGVFNVFDSSVTVYPSAVQSLKLGLALTESKADPEDGFAFVFYDSAKRDDKEAALKNFDESVAVAAKYVLENPDTILIVTSAALDGSKIPAFMLGNSVEKGKDAATLLDFVKTVIQAE